MSVQKITSNEVFLQVVNLSIMPRQGFSLLQLCIFLMFTGTSCDRKKPVPVTRDKSVTAEITCLFKQADHYDSTSPDSLYTVSNEILRLGQLNNDRPTVVKAEKFISRSLWRLGDHANAMKYAMRGLEHAEKWGILSEIPEIYVIIGQLHKEKMNYHMAFQAVEKGMLISKKLKDTIGIIQLARMKAMFTQGVGANTHDTALIHHSLNMQLQAVKLPESSPKFEKYKTSYYNNIAQVYVKRSQLDSAEYFVNKAIALAKKYNQPLTLTYSYTWLAQIYEGRGDITNSLFYRNKALQLARKQKNPFREMELSDYLMEGYRSAGMYKEALAAYTRYSALRDSMKVLQNVRQVGELELKYNDEKKDRQISSLRELNTLRLKQTFGAFTVLGLILIFSITMLNQYHIIRKNNLVLAENNRMINEQSEKMQFLMKELHHRVKNNLQIVSNLLSIQGNRLSDDNARSIIKAGQQRIETMSIIHKSLYSQENTNMVNMNEYITNLLASIQQSFGTEEDQVTFNIRVEVEELDVDIAMPLGLIINEWITNSFKHAFHHVKNPAIFLNMKEIENQFKLEIRDNGPGFDHKRWDQPNGSFGIKLIKVLSKQLEGKCRVIQGSGACFQLEIPANNMKMSA